MSSLVDEILSLQDRFNNETQSHLQQKAELTRKFRTFTEDEKQLLKKVDMLKEKTSSGDVSVRDTSSLNVPELISKKHQMEEKTNSLKKDLIPTQDNLTRIQAQV